MNKTIFIDMMTTLGKMFFASAFASAGFFFAAAFNATVGATVISDALVAIMTFFALANIGVAFFVAASAAKQSKSTKGTRKTKRPHRRRA